MRRSRLTLVGLPAWKGDGSVLTVAEDPDGREAIGKIGMTAPCPARPV